MVEEDQPEREPAEQVEPQVALRGGRGRGQRIGECMRTGGASVCLGLCVLTQKLSCYGDNLLMSENHVDRDDCVAPA